MRSMDIKIDLSKRRSSPYGYNIVTLVLDFDTIKVSSQTPIFQALNWIIGSTGGRFLCLFHSYIFLHIIRFPHAEYSYLILELLDSNIMNMYGSTVYA